MTKKTKALRTLTLYFMEKGKILDVREYKSQKDAPIKLSNIRKILGPYSRLEKLIARNFPDQYVLIGQETKEPGEKKEVKVEDSVSTEDRYERLRAFRNREPASNWRSDMGVEDEK